MSLKGRFLLMVNLCQCGVYRQSEVGVGAAGCFGKADHDYGCGAGTEN